MQLQGVVHKRQDGFQCLRAGGCCRPQLLGLEFGFQLLQMLQSDEIRERTATEFDLMNVYRIDADGGHKRAELREAYEDHVTFEFTKFGSVRVEVLDEDPLRRPVNT